MRLTSSLFLLVIGLALPQARGSTIEQRYNDGTPTTPYTIYGPTINATFIPHGARLTNLFVPDKNGNMRDVSLGYDDLEGFVRDTQTNRTFFGAIVGRYANRIKNGTFNIDGQDFNIPKNEHGGLNTLHGGTTGYDGQNWTVVAHDSMSITFSFYDNDGNEGFPGNVANYVTYSISNVARLTCRMVSIPLDKKTPIMLAHHGYWNLGSFTQATVLNDTLEMPYAKRTIATDTIQIPTGEIDSVVAPWQNPPLPLNFTSPKTIGDGSDNSKQCGYGCTGIDNAWILDRPPTSGPKSLDPYALKWSSPDTGITMTVRTNQGGLQIYDCVGQNGTIPVKSSQKANGVDYVQKYGCLVVETQQWIDGINNPGWGVEDVEVFSGNTEPAVNIVTYDFSLQ